MPSSKKGPTVESRVLTGEGLCDPDSYALLNLVVLVSLEFTPWYAVSLWILSQRCGSGF
jgi:hypothetical protein